MLLPPFELWRNSVKGTIIAMLFLHTYLTLVSDCKDTKKLLDGRGKM